MATTQVSSLLVVERRGRLSLWLEARLSRRGEDLCIVADFEVRGSDVRLLLLIELRPDLVGVTLILELSLLLSQVLTWHLFSVSEVKVVMLDVLDKFLIRL